MHKKLEDEKKLTMEKIEESKKALQEFNVSKIAVILSGVFQRKLRQSKTKAFDSLLMYSRKLDLIFKRQEKSRVHRIKTEVMRQWSITVKQSRYERQLENEERERRFLEQVEQRALKRLDVKRMKLVWRSLMLNMQYSKDEKLIESEHNQRKNQIDNFFTNLKKKVEGEKSKMEELKQDQQQKDELKERVRQHAM